MFSIRRTLLLALSRGLQISSRSLGRLASQIERLAEARADEVVEEAVERDVAASVEGGVEQVGGPPAHWLERVQAAGAPAHWLEHVQGAGKRQLAQPAGDVKAHEERVAPVPVVAPLAEDVPDESPQAVEAPERGRQADHAPASRLLPPTAPDPSVTGSITKQESAWQKPQDVVSEGKVKADEWLKDGPNELPQAVEGSERGRQPDNVPASRLLPPEPISIESGKAEQQSVSAPAARRSIARSEAVRDKSQDLPSERAVKADELVMAPDSTAEAGDPSAEGAEVAPAARPITRQDEKGGRIPAMRFRPRPKTRAKSEQREVESRPTEVEISFNRQPSAPLVEGEQAASQTSSEQVPAEGTAFAHAEQIVSGTDPALRQAEGPPVVLRQAQEPGQEARPFPPSPFERREKEASHREPSQGQSIADQAHVLPKRAKPAERPAPWQERSSRAPAKANPWPDFEWSDPSPPSSWSAEELELELEHRWPALPREEQHVRLAERAQLAEEWEMKWRTLQRRKRLDLEQRGHLWNESLF